jgi:hypothetical protein
VRAIIFTVCKQAVIQKGLLSITNAFSNLLVQDVPATNRFMIATRLFFSLEERGRFSGLFRLIDPDACEIARSPMEFDIVISESDVTGVFVDAVGEMAVTFKTTGEHQFHLESQGQLPIVIPFYVSKRASSSGR